MLYSPYWSVDLYGIHVLGITYLKLLYVNAWDLVCIFRTCFISQYSYLEYRFDSLVLSVCHILLLNDTGRLHNSDGRAPKLMAVF